MRCYGPAPCQADASFKVTFGRDRIARGVCPKHAWRLIERLIDLHQVVEVERV